jgi:RNA polymerase sigma-70 factor (sigma-E family)
MRRLVAAARTAERDIAATAPLSGAGAEVSALFDRHYVPLVRLARLLVDDRATAEDVVMDAFLSLHRHWNTLNTRDSAYAYLRASVLNGGRSQLRQRRVRRRHDTGSTEDRLGPDDLATAHATHATVMGAVRALPYRQRQVLVLRFYLELSEAEVAEVLGIGLGTVKQHSSRGLAKLAKALEATR